MKAGSVRTLAQARAFVQRVRICGIFSDIDGHSLWDAVDLPHRQGGDTKWGLKVEAVWAWKNDLPARYPDAIFYGKVPGGLAALMSIDYLATVHYPRHHRPLDTCSPLAQKIFRLLRFDPLTTSQLRQELVAPRNRIDRALVELQTTLNIVRRNSLSDKRDTWLPFREQYLSITQTASS